MAGDSGECVGDGVGNQGDGTLQVLLIANIGVRECDVNDASTRIPHRTKRRRIADSRADCYGLATDSTATAEDGAAVIAGREKVGSGEDYRRGKGQKVGTKERKHVTSDGDEVGVLFNLEENKFSSLLKSEDGVWDAFRDKASAVIEIGASGTTGGDWLAREASREVDDGFGGDWAGKIGVGEGNSSWVMCSIYPLLDAGLLAQNSYARAAVRERRGERADAGEVLNGSRMIPLKPPG